MARKIYVDPARLTTASKEVQANAQEYERSYLEIYKKVEEMGAAWKGADNSAFVERIHGYKPFLEGIKKHMEDYSEFLRHSADLYRNTQSDIAASARTLAN